MQSFRNSGNIIQAHSTPKLTSNMLLVPQGYMPVEKYEIRKYLFKLFSGKFEIKCQNNFENINCLCISKFMTLLTYCKDVSKISKP